MQRPRPQLISSLSCFYIKTYYISVKFVIGQSGLHSVKKISLDEKWEEVNS